MGGGATTAVKLLGGEPTLTSPSVRDGERLARAVVSVLLRQRVDRKLAAAYRGAVAEHFRTVERTCRSLQVFYARVDIEDPVERAVVDLLRRGAMVG